MKELKLYLGVNLITKITSDDVIYECALIDKKFDRFLKKITLKFVKRKWGLITLKDKLINDIMLKGNYSGIVGVYRHKQYGAFFITLPPLSNTLTIESYFYEDKWDVIELKRGRVFPEYGDVW